MSTYTAGYTVFREIETKPRARGPWIKKGLRGVLLAISFVISIGWVPFFFWCICH